MRKSLKFIGLIFIICLSIYLTAYYFYFSKHIVIQEGQTLTKEINLEKGTLYLKKNSVLSGSVKINEGNITLEEGAKILGWVDLGEGEINTGKKATFENQVLVKKGELNFGEENHLKESLTVERGNILIKEKTVFEKNINQKKGFLRLEEGVEIKGDVILNKVEVEKHSSVLIKGIKPKVYRTYDWPKVLQYFDVLPEAHKNSVGYIFLTKDENGLIRDDKILEAKEYFEGVYDYKDGKLITLNLEDEKLMKGFFDRAKEFFTSVPERRLVYFNVGATTKNYAHDSNFADIYLPSDKSNTLFIHEMGHVMDFKYDFSDLHDPKFPWTKEDAMTSYGATHPGEDFAEAYQIYALNQDAFSTMIEENSERQKKYDFLSTYVFSK